MSIASIAFVDLPIASQPSTFRPNFRLGIVLSHMPGNPVSAMLLLHLPVLFF